MQNTGNETLTNVVVTDPTDPHGATVATLPTLAPQASQTFTYSVTATQAEIDAGGSIVNTAIVTDTQNANSSSTVTTPVEDHPAVSIVKTASTTPTIAGDPANSVDEAGQTIYYTITVQNTGNETLTNVVVTDPTDPHGATVATLPTLAPQASQTFTYSVTATQAEIDAGAPIVNTAIVTDTQNANGSSTVTTPVEDHPAVSIVKTASTTPTIAGDPANSVDEAGQTIYYTITVQNTGNETLTNVVVTDPTDPHGATVATLPTLAPQASQTFTYSVTATQAEIDAGAPIVNTAIVTDTQNATGSSTVTTPVEDHPAVSIVKTASTTPTIAGDPANSVDEAGQTIYYTITVQNTGNETLTNVVVTDPTDPGGATVATLPTLAPQASQTFTYSVTATQAEIDAGGSIVNTAIVTDTQNANSSSTVTTPVEDHPAVSIVKTASTTPTIAGDPANSVDEAGQTIYYTITVQNTGNETLTNVVVTDPTDPGGATVATLPTLAPQASQTFTYSVTATQAEIDAGAPIVNTAIVTDTQNANSSSTVTTPVEDHPAVSIVKTASTTPTIAGDPANSVDEAGQTIYYTITVQNTGNETLTNVVVTDPTDPHGATVATLPTLAPQASQTFTYSVTATQAEIDAGAPIVNTAIVTDTQNANSSSTVTTPVENRSGGFDRQDGVDDADHRRRPGQLGRRGGADDLLHDHGAEHRQRDADQRRGHRPDRSGRRDRSDLAHARPAGLADLHLFGHRHAG